MELSDNEPDDVDMNVDDQKELAEVEEQLKNQATVVEKTVLDVSKSSRTCWLVKAPSFLNDIWRSAEYGSSLGSVKIGPAENNSETPAVTVHVNSLTVPKNYNIKFISKPEGNVLVFNEGVDGKAVDINASVQYECHTTPIIDDDYLNIMRTRREDAEKPKRSTQLVEAKGNIQGVISGSLLSSGSRPIPVAKKRKAEDFRRGRLPKEELIETVFKAYQKHQNWSLKELVELTDQPVAYMKEILSEICVYISRGPYKATYQLKPEYKST